MKNKNNIITGYRNPQIKLYRTDIKPLGYLVAGLGVLSLSVAVFPNGLGFVFYPLGFKLLSLVGIRLSKRDILNKFQFTRRFL